MYFLLITKHILLINHKCVYLYQYKSFRHSEGESTQGECKQSFFHYSLYIILLYQINLIFSGCKITKRKWKAGRNGLDFLSKISKLLMEGEINIHFFRNADGWQGWQTPPQKNRKLVSQVSPNKLAPIKGSTENGDRWHFYILFFLWLTARK